ncbi:Tropomodulin, partial [Toxocara canis]
GRALAGGQHWDLGVLHISRRWTEYRWVTNEDQQTVMNRSDYYAEEKNLTAPSARNTAGTGGGFKLYGRDLRDLDDADLEGLLSKLSPEELEDLNNDFDPDGKGQDETTGTTFRGVVKAFEPKVIAEEPENETDNSLLPPSQRCRNQTTKKPTGPFQREKLLLYLEETAKKEKDWEEPVPFSPGIKRELFVASFSAMSQSNNEETYRPVSTRLEADDENLTEVNINNLRRTSKERIKNLIKAACASKHIKKLAMANTGISDQEARGLVELLETSPSLRVLNIESNFISPELLAKLLRATLVTQHLIEFHAENQNSLLPPSQRCRNQTTKKPTGPFQREKLLLYLEETAKKEKDWEEPVPFSPAVLGNQVEMDMMLSVEENETLLRVGVAFQSMEARHRVSEALERNYERLGNLSYTARETDIASVLEQSGDERADSARWTCRSSSRFQSQRIQDGKRNR